MKIISLYDMSFRTRKIDNACFIWFNGIRVIAKIIHYTVKVDDVLARYSDMLIITIYID